MKKLLLLLFPITVLAQGVTPDATIKSNTNTLIRSANPVLRASHSMINDELTDSKLSRVENNQVSGTNTYTASVSWVNGYTKGLTIPVFFTNGNTGPCTINVSSVGTATIQINGNALTGGEIVANIPYTLIYDGSYFQLRGAAPVIGVLGTSNRITVTGSTYPTINISPSYVGQNSINTLGTIGTGVWNGTRLSSSYVPQGTANSVWGVAGSSISDQASIVAGLDGNVLRRSGSTLGFGAIDLTNSNAVSGLLPISNGGTGTSSPGIVAGTNITVTGSWPNQTINSTGGSPGGTNTNVQYNSSGSFGGSSAFTFTSATNSLLVGNGTNGSVTINTSGGTPVALQNSSSNQFLFQFSGVNTILSNSTGDTEFDVGGSDRLHIKTNGAVGFNNSYGSSGQVLQSNGASSPPTWVPVSTGSPGGSNTYIQYNNSGSFGGSSKLTWDDTNYTMTLHDGGGLSNGILSIKAVSSTSAGNPDYFFNSTPVTTRRTAGDNIGIGAGALTALTNGAGNTVVGMSGTGSGITTGVDNTLVGNAVATGLSTGSHNVSIGDNITLPTSNGSNQIVIGAVSTFSFDGSSMWAMANTTATLDFPNTLLSTSSDLTITVTGAASGDMVSLGVPNAAVNANSCYTAWVSASNTVTIRFNNYSTGSINPASGTFKVLVTH